MSTRRGGSLENAILLASRRYRKAGVRVVLVKQNPPMATVKGFAQEVGGAPVDFVGVHNGALAIEAKETKGKSLALSRLRDDQVSLMGLLAASGARVQLVAWFSDLDEVYAVDWEEVATFLATAYRASWPLCWFRAVGRRLPVEEDGGRWAVQFLDGAPHPDRGKALEELEKDRAKPRTARETEPDDDLSGLISQQKPSPYRGLTIEQVRARLMDAMQEGTERQVKKPRREWKRRKGAA